MKSMIVSCFAICALAASAAEFSKDWKIVYPDRETGAEPCVDYALRVLAKEMAADLEEATGWKLPVVAQSEAPEGTKGIWLGAPAAKRAGFSFPDWKYLENAYAATNGNVYCFGNDRQGFANAVYYEWNRAVLPSARAAMRFMLRRGVRRAARGSWVRATGVTCR